MLLDVSSVLQGLKTGDALALRRENSRFDDFAIMILNGDGNKIGYIPEKDNRIFARLMDAGKRLIARVDSIDRRGGFVQIRIGICLIDF